MINDEIKKLMMEAIEYPRPKQIENFCSPIWNQPFFYKIDMAQALTISYNPTDKGARTNYPAQVAKYQAQGHLPTEEIYEILYNFKKENYWRKNYDIIFNTLGVDNQNVAHMDISFFPYSDFQYFLKNVDVDDTREFLYKAIDLLSDQLKYILVDGAKNKKILQYLIGDYNLIKVDSRPINGGAPHELRIYRHKTKDITLIYYACFLYGQTCPKKTEVKKLAEYIAKTIR